MEKQRLARGTQDAIALLIEDHKKRLGLLMTHRKQDLQAEMDLAQLVQNERDMAAAESAPRSNKKPAVRTRK